MLVTCLVQMCPANSPISVKLQTLDVCACARMHVCVCVCVCVRVCVGVCVCWVSRLHLIRCDCWLCIVRYGCCIGRFINVCYYYYLRTDVSWGKSNAMMLVFCPSLVVLRKTGSGFQSPGKLLKINVVAYVASLRAKKRKSPERVAGNTT